MDSDRVQIFNGPYRSTKLWNEIVKSFCCELPLKRHRRNMRVYDSCFVACDAVDWLNDYLNGNPNFAFNITRCQTVQLLQKFVKSGLIKILQGGKPLETNYFKDNKDLYRFSQISPSKNCGLMPARASLRVCTNEALFNWVSASKSRSTIQRCVPSNVFGGSLKSQSPEQRFVALSRPTVAEIESRWSAAFCDNFQRVLNLSETSDIFSRIRINPKHIIHNASSIGASGIVNSLDRANELPHWVLSAMKCLVSWPKATGIESCLPNYPGFERDVFQVVKKYFQNLDEPLTTFALYEVLVFVYAHVERLDTTLHVQLCCADYSRVCESQAVPPVLDNGYELMVSSTPIDSGVQAQCSNPFEWKRPADPRDAVEPLPSYACYETAFFSGSPVTRIVVPQKDRTATSDRTSRPGSILSSCELNNGARHLRSPLSSSQCISVDNLNLERLFEDIFPKVSATKLSSSATQLHAVPKEHPGSFDANDQKVVFDTFLNESGGYVNLAYNENVDIACAMQPSNSCGGYVNFGCTEHSGYSCGEDYFGTQILEASHAECGIASSRRPLRRSFSSTDLRSRDNSCADVLKCTSNLGTNANDGCWNPPDQCLRQRADTKIRTLHAKSLAVEAFQLCLLLIPPYSRRNLHRLLRFMSRTADNALLQLDTCVPNRHLVLRTFTRSLLRAEREADCDEVVSAKVVGFLLDNHDAVFAAPTKLIQQVESWLTSVKTMVTAEEYEKQKQRMSEQALVDLLTGIIVDSHLSRRQRKKKLKQFKKTYPEIYERKFPQQTGISEGHILKKPLKKLLEMRL